MSSSTLLGRVGRVGGRAIAIFFARQYDITRARHAEILKELADRRSNEAGP